VSRGFFRECGNASMTGTDCHTPPGEIHPANNAPSRVLMTTSASAGGGSAMASRHGEE
jgi:hypothetical protein